MTFALNRYANLVGAVVAALVFVFAVPTAAQEVVPTDRVKSGVLVRAEPDPDAEVIDALTPGESLEFQGTVPDWNQVLLPDGRTGFVSNRWTRVLGRDAPPPAGTYRIHVVDVGTGLGVFVEGPDFTLVYDAGSNDDTTNRFVAYLHHVRPSLTVIDHLVLSHPHKDHVSMLPGVLSEYRVLNVWDSGRMVTTCVYRNFLKAVAEEDGVQLHGVAGGSGRRRIPLPAKCGEPATTLTVDRGSQITGSPVTVGRDASITFLHRDVAEYADPNENTLVARLDVGRVPIRILLTGDEEAGRKGKDPNLLPDRGSIEEELLACCRADLRAHLMFAGHHGSWTSSRRSFVDAVGAKMFVISSGPKTYGSGDAVLPTPAIVALLERIGSLWRTDIDDAACAQNPAKIGTDNDRLPGGCDNIVFTISSGTISPAYARVRD